MFNAKRDQVSDATLFKSMCGFLNLNRREVAHIMGVHTETIKNYEKGTATPGIGNLRKFEKFGIDAVGQFALAKTDLFVIREEDARENLRLWLEINRPMFKKRGRPPKKAERSQV
jgi:transcriptional regulator with XRE-family HTH domain